MLLEGRKLLITGVLTEGSIAYAVARRAQAEGAEIVLTGFGTVCGSPRSHPAARPPESSSSTSPTPSTLAAVARTLDERWARARRRPGAIGFGPRAPRRLHAGDGQVGGGRLRTLAYSLQTLADRARAAAEEARRLIVGLDSTHRVLAGLRLDGRGQVGARGDRPLPRQHPGPRAPGQPRLRRPATDPLDRRRHSRLRRTRRRVRKTASAAAAGMSTTPVPDRRRLPVRLLSERQRARSRARWSTSTAASTRSAPRRCRLRTLQSADAESSADAG